MTPENFSGPIILGGRTPGSFGSGGSNEYAPFLFSPPPQSAALGTLEEGSECSVEKQDVYGDDNLALALDFDLVAGEDDGYGGRGEEIIEESGNHVAEGYGEFELEQERINHY
jgi:hypothetical protein